MPFLTFVFWQEPYKKAKMTVEYALWKEKSCTLISFFAGIEEKEKLALASMLDLDSKTIFGENIIKAATKAVLLDVLTDGF